MTHTEFDSLIALYGRELVAAKIERAKSYRGCDNHDTVAKWCSEDNRRIRAKPLLHSDGRKGGFHDFPQREYDFDALEAELLKQ